MWYHFWIYCQFTELHLPVCFLFWIVSCVWFCVLMQVNKVCLICFFLASSRDSGEGNSFYLSGSSAFFFWCLCRVLFTFRNRDLLLPSRTLTGWVWLDLFIFFFRMPSIWYSNSICSLIFSISNSVCYQTGAWLKLSPSGEEPPLPVEITATIPLPWPKSLLLKSQNSKPERWNNLSSCLVSFLF